MSQTRNPLQLQSVAAVSAGDPHKFIFDKHWITLLYNEGVSELNAFNPLTVPKASRGGKGQRGQGAPVPPSSATPLVLGSITCCNCKRNESPKLLREQEESGKNWSDAEWSSSNRREKIPKGAEREQRGEADFSPGSCAPHGATGTASSSPGSKLHLQINHR